VLHGALADAFGRSFRLDIDTPVEAVRALALQIPDFRAQLREGNYHVVRGSPDDRGLALDAPALKVGLGRAPELHIIPAVAGAGGKPGVWQTIAGAVLLAAAFAVTVFAPPLGGAAYLSVLGFQISAGQLAVSGALLTLQGVSQMMAKTPTMSGNTAEQDKRESFLFGPGQTTMIQGGPVPLVFGRYRTRGVLVSAGIVVEQVGAGVATISQRVGGGYLETTILDVFENLISS